MNHTQILKRAWTITWKYRALWVLGFLLALTSGGGGGSGSGGSNGSGYQFNGNGRDWNFDFAPQGLQDLANNIEAWARNLFRPEMQSTLIGLAVAFTCLAVIIGILSIIVRYVSEVGIIRMVDHYESTEEKVSWRQGWRMGWSNAAWKLFLIDLVVYLPVVLGVMVMFGCAALPVIASSVASNDLSAPGLIATIGLVFLAIFVIFAIVVVLSLFMELARRQAVLNGSGVFESIRAGWNLARSHLKDIFILWLLMVGIQIGVSIVFIPVVLLLVLAAGLLGGGVGAGLYFLLNAVATGAAAWGWGIGMGLFFFILLLSIPLTILSGIFLVYRSSVWTLAFRDVTRPLAAITPAAPAGGDVLPAA